MKHNSSKKGKNSKVSENPSTSDLDSLEKSTKKYSSSDKTAIPLKNAPDAGAYAKYDLTRPWETLDPWQLKFLVCNAKRITIVCGRQCGKTAAASILIAEEAVNIPNSYIMIGAYVIEQAEHLLWKIKDYMFTKHNSKIEGRPTLHFMELKNGSKIICKAVGDTGAGMRGPTVTLLVLDEAALIPDRAWVAIEPVISVSKGRVILLSTGQCKKGFFYKSTLDEDIEQFKVSARDCPRHSKEFLDKKEAELSPVAFAQEYLGEFLDDYNRKFTDEWIEKVCTLPVPDAHPGGALVPSLLAGRGNVLGIDVGGGVGLGETTFEGFNATDKKNVFQNLNINSNTIAGPDIERQIETLKNQYNYGRKSIGFDSRGVGSGSFAYMLENSKLKRCIVALDNATRPIDNEKATTKLLKEYMYDVVEEMGWRGELHCFDEGVIKQSFQSIQTTIRSNGDRAYSGSYDHIVEGIIRAVWMAKCKGLSIMAFC